MATLQVRVQANDVKEYRRLLTSDWTEGDFDDLMELIGAQLPADRELIDYAFDGTLFDPCTTASRSVAVDSTLLELCKTNVLIIGKEPPASIQPPVTKNHQWWDRLVLCMTALVLPARCGIAGNRGYFLDLLSLLFLQTIHSLVPTIRKKSDGKALDLLWHVMALHCFTGWQHNLAQQQYLLANLFHELDQGDRELEALKNSFSLTRIDDHDFLSKAQSVWSCLLDQGQAVEAREFILYVARIAPPNAIGELNEMMSDSMLPAKSA